MAVINWISNNYIEVFGAVAGIVYVFLEVKQNLWLWPVGIVTSAVYIWVFFTGKLYADMGLQGYYLVISCLGLYWWINGRRQRAEGGGHKEQKPETRSETTQFREEEEEHTRENDQRIHGKLAVSRVSLRLGIILLIIFLALFSGMYFVLDRFTDSPVPGWDSFITSLSIVATWMLARKILEHWYLWIVVNGVAVILFITRGLYPTVVLYIIYGIMSFIGLREWKRTMNG